MPKGKCNLAVDLIVLYMTVVLAHSSMKLTGKVVGGSVLLM